MLSSLRQVAVYITKRPAVLTNSWHVNLGSVFSPQEKVSPALPQDLCSWRVVYHVGVKPKSELPCQDALGQLPAICVTVHISANKPLFALPYAVSAVCRAAGMLPVRERATACTEVSGWHLL